MTGYVPFKPGTQVEFFRKGVWQTATVVDVHLDPNRKPGAGRVSYDVQTHPCFYPLRVAAKKVRAHRGCPTVEE